jgi:hypothetical protein
MKKGVYDLCLPFPAKEFHGLYIEMKFEDGKTSEAQDEFAEFANSVGYKTVVCWTAEDAIDVIIEYLN